MNQSPLQELDWRRRIFDSLSFPTLVLKPDRTIVAANLRLLDTFGLTLKEVVGKSCREFFQTMAGDPDLPCTRDSCPLDQTIAEGQGNSISRRIKRKDGGTYWEDRVFSPILDAQGRVVYVIESIRNVTRTKILEMSLHGVQEFFNRVLQSSASAIVAADRQGQLLLMNPAAEEMFGYHLKPGSHVEVSALYPPGVAREIMKKLRDKTFGGRGKLPLTQVTILTAKGEAIPVEMTAAIIYEDGQEAATMGIYNDLRERLSVSKKLRDAQSQLIQAEKLASLGQLAAGVAHEINNPLTGILMYGNLLQEELKDNPAVQKSLHFILEDTERCRDIVKNLLAYSRQSGGSRERFQLNALVDESFTLIRDQKLFINIRVRKFLSGDSLPLRADRKKMSQVIINLIMNALDAMDRKGSLTLRTYRDDAQHQACLEVADTGSGIPPEHLNRIFDPFFTTKDPGKGTGLGLSTAFGIVKENQGEITVKETGTQGTTFLVTLPLDAESREDFPETIG